MKGGHRGVQRSLVPNDAGSSFSCEMLDVLKEVSSDIPDPDSGAIPGALPPAERRDTDPERPGDVRCGQIPGFLQLEHSPVTATVVVAVDVAGNPAPIVAGLEPDHRSAPALAAVLPLVLLEPSERDGGQ
jgi:hypothetical protein